MFVVRAPVRISFGGGGTDLPAYYERYGGMVVSTTITKYVYVVARQRRAADVQINSVDLRQFWCGVPSAALTPDAPMSLPRAVLSYFGVEQGVELTIAAEVLPGTGLGSSSACAVAVGAACLLLKGEPLDRRLLADAACHVEIEMLQAPIGRQDQYAAAFGGLNELYFADEGVSVAPLALPAELRATLSRRLLLFYTGRSRLAATVLSEQQSASRAGVPTVLDALHAIKSLGLGMRDRLSAGDLDGFGGLLHEAWQHKRRISERISSPAIDAAYAAAREAGALGGKLTGAGGGGFLLLYAHPEQHRAIGAALAEQGLQRLDAELDTDGVQIVAAP